MIGKKYVETVPKVIEFAFLCFRLVAVEAAAAEEDFLSLSWIGVVMMEVGIVIEEFIVSRVCSLKAVMMMMLVMLLLCIRDRCEN